jgi:hypothetical protein
MIPDPQQPYSGTGSERHIGITIHPTTKVGDESTCIVTNGANR